MRALFVAFVFVLLGAGPAALAASPQARYEAGLEAYQRGEDARALEIFKRLVTRGDPGAEFMLGAMYFYGRGVRRNDGIAAVWFHKAANQGNREAQLAYGSLLIQGVGARQDIVKAHMWLSLVVETGDAVLREHAVRLRDQAVKLMTADELADARRRARDFRPRRAGLAWP